MRGAFALALVFVACSRYAGEDAPSSSDGGDGSGLDASASDAALDTLAPAPKCGDPGSLCVPVPAGFTLVSRNAAPGSDAGAPSCPPYFTDPRTIVANARPSAATCNCTCGAPKVSPCESGYLQLFVSQSGGSTDCSDTGTSIFPSGEGCTSMTLPSQVTRVEALPMAKTQTDGVTTANLPPLAFDARYTVCTSPPPAPCSDGQCVAIGSTLDVCALAEGEKDCPAGFPSRTVVGTESALQDGRACTSCSTCQCTAASCGSPSLTFYTAADCSDVGTNIPVDSVCAVRSVASATRFKYKAAANNLSCVQPAGAMVSNVNGTVDYPKQTLCCK